MKEINRNKAVEVIKATNGGFFTATFIKKDGTVRTMNGRLGVAKDLKGVGSTVARPDTPYITVYESKGQYRVLNLNTLTEIHANHEIYKVTDYGGRA